MSEGKYTEMFGLLHDVVMSCVKEVFVVSGDALASDALQSLSNEITVAIPKNSDHGDVATNAAMMLARYLRSVDENHNLPKSPIDIANILLNHIVRSEFIKSATVVSPGFINIILHDTIFDRMLHDIILRNTNYGSNNYGKNEPVNIEFVSANPTGPMHIGHSRSAVYGDCLANLMSYCGYNVTREFYINDAGNQIDTLAKSAYLRYVEVATDMHIDIPEGYYPGEYMIAVGRKLYNTYGSTLLSEDILNADMLPASTIDILKNVSVSCMLDQIKDDLHACGVKHDVFTSEKHLRDSGKVQSALQKLQDLGLTYFGILEKPKGYQADESDVLDENDIDGKQALLFKSTEYGDDMDRVLQRSNGELTYFGGDAGYAVDKIERGFLQNIITLGADHAGYVKRMESLYNAIAMAVYKHEHKEDVTVGSEVILCQLVKLVNDGKILKMSKRRGVFVTLREVIDDIGSDALRFMMLTRKNDVVFDFDLALAHEQSKDNPVFYVQYAHVRCKSVIENAKNAQVIESENDVDDYAHDNSISLAELLNSEHERSIIKTLSMWPVIVKSSVATKDLQKITSYLYDLSAMFHSMWNVGKNNEDYKFVVANNITLSKARVLLAKAVSIVIANGLRVLGIEPLNKM